MKQIMCECGKQMEFDSVFITGIEEFDDFYVCECGKKKDYYSAIEE